MKNYSEIIIRPLLTEKSNLLSETSNKYVFQVSLDRSRKDCHSKRISPKARNYSPS